MFLAYHVQGRTKIEKLVCANQSHLMQMVDGWGFQRVLHYESPGGMECAVYCHAVGDATAAPHHMCLAITNMGSVPGPIRLQDISQFVVERYTDHAHPPLRLGTRGIVSTPNGGSMQTPKDLSLWCDRSTDALTRYHVLFNIPPAEDTKKRKRNDDKNPFDSGVSERPG